VDINTTTGLFDPSKSYEQNMLEGPFVPAGTKPYKNVGVPSYDFFGTPVYSPFGIAAGPLPRAKFVRAALDAGYDIITFKSVRTRIHPCHSNPNVAPLDIDELKTGNSQGPITIKPQFSQPLSLANSFGIPSLDPAQWQAEMKKSFSLLKPGQAMLVALQGTDRGEGHQAFVDDHVLGAKLLRETGAKIIEIDFSCPNEGSPELVCFNAPVAREIVEAVQANVPGLRLIVKIAYFKDKQKLRDFVQQVGPLVAGITAINTVPAEIVDQEGKQFFPGGQVRAKAGVSGNAIKYLAQEMVNELSQLRKELDMDYTIIGVGGVLSAQDFHERRAAGADIVMGLTGVMWNLNLAAEIKASI